MKINIQNNFKRVSAFLKLNTQKRVLPLLAAFAVILCCLSGVAVPASANEISDNVTESSGDGFSLYAGAKLPHLPEWDKEVYPYAAIFYRLIDGLYDLYLSSAPFVYDVDSGRVGFPDGTQTCYVYTSSGGVWSENLDNFTEQPCLVQSPNGELLWSNYDVLSGADGTLYFSATEPISLDAMLVVEWNGDTSGLGTWGYAGYGTFYKVLNSVISLDAICVTTRLDTSTYTLTRHVSTGYDNPDVGDIIYMSGDIPQAFGNILLSYVWLYYNAEGTVYTATTLYAYPVPTVSSVTVSAENEEPLYPGLSKQFGAVVDGRNNPDYSVTWSVNGATSGDTFISDNGLLSVGVDETASTLSVVATSVQDVFAYGSVDVAVTPLPTDADVQISPDGLEVVRGRTYEIQLQLLFADGTVFDYPGLVWDVIGDFDIYAMSSDGVLSVAYTQDMSSAIVRVFYPWMGDSAIDIALVTMRAPTDSEMLEDMLSGNKETNEKLDDLISGGEAGEALGGTTDEMDNKNEELGGVMDEYENAQNQMPTTPSDVSGLVNMDDFNAAVDTLALVLKWDEMGIAGMYIPMAMVLGVAALCYIVFGKKR